VKQVAHASRPCDLCISAGIAESRNTADLDNRQRLRQTGCRKISVEPDRGAGALVNAPLLLMQSNGGLTTAKAAAVTPMNIINGPLLVS
jgi:hypothetical protein